MDDVKRRGQKLRDNAGCGEGEAQSFQRQQQPSPQPPSPSSVAANKRSDEQCAESTGESSDIFVSDFDDEEVHIGDSR